MNPSIRLVSIEGCWGQPIYPPQPPKPRMADLLPEQSRLRPAARALFKALLKKEKPNG